jgi:signal transduction histidine kinase
MPRIQPRAEARPAGPVLRSVRPPDLVGALPREGDSGEYCSGRGSHGAGHGVQGLDRLSGFSQVSRSYDEHMVRAANVVMRTGLLVLAGILTFRPPWPGAAVTGAAPAAEVAVFAVATFLMAFWAFAESTPSRRARFGVFVPCAFALIALGCGVAAALPAGNDMIIVSAIAVAGAGSRPSLATGYTVLGLGTLGIVSTGLALGDGVWTTAAFPGVLLVAFLLGSNQRAHRVEAEQAAALLARAEELHAEQAKVATLNERTRIAREIHDVLAHSLGALGLNIQLAQAVLTDQHDEARAVDLLEQAHRMTSEGLAETRRAVHALRGQTPPLPQGLAQLSATHQRRHGAPVTFEVSGRPRPLSPDAALALTRTAQEALVNTAKHAPHRPVVICLDYADAGTSLMVTSQLGDDSPDQAGPALATVDGGFGLTGMRERLQLLEGTLSAGRDGEHWVVVARVPQ